MKDEWTTDLSDEVWDIRPEPIRHTHEARYIGRGEWQNHFGEVFKPGDTVIIKSWTEELAEQNPIYTYEMAELFEGQKLKIKYIEKYNDVALEDAHGIQTRFTWNLDWFEHDKPLKELDDLFEL
jgi:hypothetical protein